MWWTPSSKPQTQAPAGSSWRDATPLTGQTPTASSLLATCLTYALLPTCPLLPVQQHLIIGLSTHPLACLLGANKALNAPCLVCLSLCLSSCRRTAWPCQPPTLRPGLCPSPSYPPPGPLPHGQPVVWSYPRLGISTQTRWGCLESEVSPACFPACPTCLMLCGLFCCSFHSLLFFNYFK